MNFRGHLIGGCLAWIASAVIFFSLITYACQLNDIPMIIASFMLALLGGLLPDIDTSKSRIGGAFEKLYFIGVLITVVYFSLFSELNLQIELKAALAVIGLVTAYFLYTEFIEEHRTRAIYGTHALKAGVVFSLILFFTTSMVMIETQAMILASSLFVGYISHLVCDNEVHI